MIATAPVARTSQTSPIRIPYPIAPQPFLGRLAREAELDGHSSEINLFHLAAALIADPEGPAFYALEEEGTTESKLRNYLLGLDDFSYVDIRGNKSFSKSVEDVFHRSFELSRGRTPSPRHILVATLLYLPPQNLPPYITPERALVRAIQCGLVPQVAV